MRARPLTRGEGAARTDGRGSQWGIARQPDADGLLLFNLKTDVKGGCGMGDGTDGDAVNAGLGDRADGFQCHTARSLQLDPAIPPDRIAQAHGLLHVWAVHVVKQDDADALDLQDFAKLFETVDFDLYQA